MMIRFMIMARNSKITTRIYVNAVITFIIIIVIVIIRNITMVLLKLLILLLNLDLSLEFLSRVLLI